MGVAGSSMNGGKAVLPRVGFGRYEVGCADVMVADGNEGDAGVFARIFYPSEDASISKDCYGDHGERPVWCPRKEYIDGVALYTNSSPRKLHFLMDWLVGERRESSCMRRLAESIQVDWISAGWHRKLHAPTRDDCLQFPVVLFSHGLSACRHFHATFCTSLASYGFVVAAIEHRDRSACWTYKLDVDPTSGAASEKPITHRKLLANENEYRIRNQQLHKRVTECVKLLNVLEEINLGQCAPAEKKQLGCKVILGQGFDWSQFKGRLDISRASIVGHSFGGATALATSAFSTDFTSAVVLDGWMMPMEREIYPRVQQPTMFLNAAMFQWPANVRSMMRVGSDNMERLLVTFNEASHQSFTDFSLLSPGFLGRRFGFQGAVEPWRCAEAQVELTVQFLRRHSLGEDIDLRSTLERYRDFAFEGTNLEWDETINAATTATA